MKWKKIGEGSFNISYRSDNGRGNSVLKIAINQEDITDLPERSVRLWNLINKHILPPAKLYREKIKGKWVTLGWICPYIEGRQANDSEIRDELLNIFNRSHGRVITDAMAHRNFLRTRDGQTICIDIGLALQGEAREQAGLVGMTRRHSRTSLEVWDEYASHSGRGAWLDRQKKDFPKSTKMTKALLFIKEQRPDITDVTFLKKSPKTITLLANAYDAGPGTVFDQAIAQLSKKCSPALEEIKQHCRGMLLDYIHTKGTIDNNDIFIPNSHEVLRLLPFIHRVIDLVSKINLAQSCEECHAIIGQYVAEHSEQIELDRRSSASLSPDPTQAHTSRFSKSEIDNAIQYIEEATKDLVLLTDIQKQCRDILNAYLLSFGISDHSETQSSTADYKSQLILDKLEQKVTILISELDHAENFEEMHRYLEDFYQKLPQTLVQDNSTEETYRTLGNCLIASVNYCRVIVASAQKATLYLPSADSDPSLEF